MSIELTVSPHDKQKKILGYAVCRQWKGSSHVDVHEYASSVNEAKDIIRQEKKRLGKDARYKWFVGVYQ
jgi:hypothetical protein